MARLCMLFMILCLGCGTTRSTDSTRAATEMLLTSQAIDKAVAQIDFKALAGRTCYVDTDFLDKGVVDRGYLVSSIRHQLVAAGALLKDDEKAVEFMVEVRSGGVGTDRSTLLVGSPALTLPSIVPGVPTSIPEIALYKRNDQKGVAKVGVFAYQRSTGRAVWQTDIVQEVSTLKDRWVLGSGPYTSGTIRPSTQFAGEELPKIPLISKDTSEPNLLPAGHFGEVGPTMPVLGLIGGGAAVK